MFTLSLIHRALSGLLPTEGLNTNGVVGVTSTAPLKSHQPPCCLFPSYTVKCCFTISAVNSSHLPAATTASDSSLSSPNSAAGGRHRYIWLSRCRGGEAGFLPNCARRGSTFRSAASPITLLPLLSLPATGKKVIGQEAGVGLKCARPTSTARFDDNPISLECALREQETTPAS